MTYRFVFNANIEMFKRFFLLNFLEVKMIAGLSMTPHKTMSPHVLRDRKILFHT